MKQMIEKKNEMLKKAGDAFKEIFQIYRMMNDIELDSSNYRTLLKLVNSRIGTLSCSYGDYLDESELYLPEAEEDGVEDDLPVEEVKADD